MNVMEYFGLNSLEGLPKIEELANMNLQAAVEAQEASETTGQETTEETPAENNTELVGQESSGQSRANSEFTTTQSEN